MKISLTMAATIKRRKVDVEKTIPTTSNSFELQAWGNRSLIYLPYEEQG